MSYELTLPFQYDFDRVLDRLSLDPLHAIDKEKRIVHVPMDKGHVVELQGTGTTENPSFLLLNADESQLRSIQSIFHFDRSLEPVYEHFKTTNLSALFEEHRGTPIVKEFSLYGTLMKSIIHQQLNLAFAHTLTTRFVHTYGMNREGVWFYPEPDVIANLKPEQLRELQFSTRKAEYVIGISKAIAEGELDLHQLAEKSDEDIQKILVHYRGIGPWTAQSFLMFGLGRPNLFPLADIGLQNALKKLWGLPNKPTAEEMMAHFPQWEPFLSYASLYLWRSIE